ncbi:hypothetical protein JCM5353_004533 [Sporobolomyces roseus]
MSNIEMQYRPLPSSDNSPIPEHHHSSSPNYSKRPAVRWGALVLATLATTVVSYNVATTRSFSPTAAGPLTLLDVNPAAAPVRQLFLNAKKNPLSATKDFKTDGNLNAEWPTEIRTGEEASVTFKCSHNNPNEMCASAYRLVLDGPSLVSPAHVLSSEVINQRQIRVRFRLDDPGQYVAYAYPEHEKCDQWNDAETQYHKLAVNGSPHSLNVTGESPKESSEICSPAQAFTEPGRWVSKAHLNPAHLIPQSPHYSWLSNYLGPFTPKPHTDYSHVWAPFNCKIPHHTVGEWLEIAKPDSIAFFGDSVIRDWFCFILWQTLFGDTPPGTTCAYSNDASYHTSNKEGIYTHRDGSTTNLRFFWAPMGEEPKVREALTGLETPPSHVFLSAALWLARLTSAEYLSKLEPGLKAIQELAPKAQTVIRGSAGVVQAIQCYDRIAGQRFQLEPHNAALQDLLATSFPTFTYFDAYSTLNSIPMASSDGRHWGALGTIHHERPQLGVGEFALMDKLFLHWS